MNIKWLLALLMLGCTCQAQSLSGIEQSFSAYQRTHLNEKVYVHTDKSFYVTGELLWCKLYVVNAGTHQPLDLSKVAYVDVLDAVRNPVLQGKIALSKGSGNGSFYIPLTLPNGNYKLRAYTNWMKNSGPELYFEKVITIVNPLKSPQAAQAKAGPVYDIQFFPEGGDMVRGVTSKVAFKLTGTDGKGVPFRGAIINQQNDTIVRFSPLMFGMGSFQFTPQAGNTYRAVVYVPGSRALYRNLPEAKTEGYVMHLTDAGNTINIDIAGSGAAGLYAFTHSHQQVVDAQSIGVNNGRGQFFIAKNKLVDGINHITLFNSSRQPVAERLYFKRPAARPMVLKAALGQSEYGIRKAVNLDITSLTGNSQFTPADLSVSVYRADSLQQTDGRNIYNYLWLGAELKGGVESPAYYFEHTDHQADEALDNLMLTQGWRRFNWQSVFSSKTAPAYLPEYAGHLIEGKLIDSVSGKPTDAIIAYLGIAGKYADMYAARSDSSGRVLFETHNFYGPHEIVLQTNTRRDSTYRIDIKSPFSEQYSDVQLPSFSINTGALHELENYNLSMQLQNVYAGNKLKQYFAPPGDSSSFYGRPYKSYRLDDFTRFTTIEEVLREYVTDISVTNRQRHFHVRTLNGITYLDDEPLVLLDGIPVFNMDRAFAIDPLKVRKLEVVRDRYFYGPAAFEGILSFTTYKGDLGGFEIDPHAVVLDYEGLQLQREFYSPVYGNSQQVNSRLPDFRNVLYWQPNAGTNAQGKSNLQFYTSDLPGRYIISIEGLSPSGEAGSQQVMFEVKK